MTNLFSKEDQLKEDKRLADELKKANSSTDGNYEDLDEFKQGSKPWFKKRLGLFTGSKFPMLMTGGRGKAEWGNTSFNVIRQVAIERDLCDTGIELYIDELYSKSFRQTEWGNKFESFAREEYKQATGNVVEETVFQKHKELHNMGGSFDGNVVGQNKIIEIKCPYDILIHQSNLELFESGEIPEKHTYYAQIQGNIEVAGVDSCDFVSFDPRRKTKDTRLGIITVERNDDFIAKLLKRILIAEAAISYIINGYDGEAAVLLAEKDLST